MHVNLLSLHLFYRLHKQFISVYAASFFCFLQLDCTNHLYGSTQFPLCQKKKPGIHWIFQTFVFYLSTIIYVCHVALLLSDVPLHGLMRPLIVHTPSCSDAVSNVLPHAVLLPAHVFRRSHPGSLPCLPTR